MRTLYISYLMFTSISLVSAADKSVEASTPSVIKKLQEVRTHIIHTILSNPNLGTQEVSFFPLLPDKNIECCENCTRIIGFGPTQKVIDRSATPATSNEGYQLPTVPEAHQPIASLYACPDRDIQIATHAPRTILHTLKKANRRNNLGSLESHNTTPIDAPATTSLRAERLQQINQLTSHSATPPLQLCYSFEETGVKNSSAIAVESSQDTSGHVEPIRGFALAETIATQEKPVLLDPQCFLYLCRR